MGYEKDKRQIDREYALFNAVRKAMQTETRSNEIKKIDNSIESDINFFVYMANVMDNLKTTPKNANMERIYETAVRNWDTSLKKTFQNMSEHKAKTQMDALLKAPQDLIRTDLWKAIYKVYLSAGTMAVMATAENYAQMNTERKNVLQYIRENDQKAAILWNKMKEKYPDVPFENLKGEIEKNNQTIAEGSKKIDQLKKEYYAAVKARDEGLAEQETMIAAHFEMKQKTKELSNDEKFNLRNIVANIEEFEKSQKENKTDSKEELANTREDYARSIRNVFAGIIESEKIKSSSDLNEIKIYAQAMLDYTEKKLEGKIKAQETFTKVATLKVDELMTKGKAATSEQKEAQARQERWVAAEKETEKTRGKLSAYEQYRSSYVKKELNKSVYYNPDKSIMKQAEIILGKKDVLRGMHINSSEYNRMVEALQVVSEWENPNMQKVLSGKKDAPKTLSAAMDNLKEAATSYLKAKDNQTRRNPSALRVSRYAFAESILDFAKTGKEGMDLMRQTEKEYSEMKQELSQNFQVENVKIQPEKPAKTDESAEYKKEEMDLDTFLK